MVGEKRTVSKVKLAQAFAACNAADLRAIISVAKAQLRKREIKDGIKTAIVEQATQPASSSYA